MNDRWQQVQQTQAKAEPQRPTPIVAVGVDLGKQRDPSALVVTEYQPILTTEDGRWYPAGAPDPGLSWATLSPDTLYVVRLIKQVQLGTSYPAVAREIVAICRRLRTGQPAARIHLLIDQTGVGAGPVDMVREILPADILLTAVTFNGTARCDPAPLSRPECSMGKAFMVLRLQTILQKRLLQMPASPMVERLVGELAGFEVRTSLTGHDTYGAFQVGTHDDLVCALGLSLLGDAHSGEVRVISPGLYG